ncbi:hypothetical protein N7468_004879 [Penicillium chermesinum]|uniref:Uncharacterized protein n=1 Tax=Penicillium chermesinum TaxID=63820 RepID=A0A9W9P9D9_9EURO|nr:uncharacterized protein N7468_004879 [Penicillium chermesinum]KAJ5240260.1 hypothetical protein N7468_004879 [Penicillium chermesinum]
MAIQRNQNCPSEADCHCRYFTNYHPFTLLLDPSVSPDTYFDRSKLLFWVIIYIASRRFSDDPTLFTALTTPLKALLWQSISNPPHNWYLVQSVSLFCLWPPPTLSLSEDTTPVLVNIAQTMAMELGLHRPESIQDFSRTKRKLTPDEITEVVRTWSVCYIASQRLASNPPPPRTVAERRSNPVIHQYLFEFCHVHTDI